MSSKEREAKRAVEYLNRLLHEAVEAGADTVELERVPGGLEICFLAGGTGLGTVLQDRTLEAELVELIVHRAGLEWVGKASHGAMNWGIGGKDFRIAVEEYDSFDESCFRLKLGKDRRRSTRNARESQRRKT
ncbi:MAG: hypothetical protein HY735_26835 [Verrucomicrobia bacterium]|nr:hypothetical protein [Verrucomicrobiota bacterium]